MHWMTLKWHWTLWGQIYTLYVLLVPLSPKVHSVSLNNQPFSRYRPFCGKCTEWPPNDLEQYKVICAAIYVLLVSTTTQFRFVSLYDQMFSRYRLFWDKCTEWHQMDLEHYKVKIALYMCKYRPRFSNSTPFRSTFSSYRLFWDKCTEWHQNGLEYNKVKGTPYFSTERSFVCTSVPESQISPRFALRPKGLLLFHDIAHFILPHWLRC